MTTKRRDIIYVSGSPYQPVSQFMLEIRDVPYLDSHKDSIIIMDNDCVIKNYTTKKFLLIEDKCYMADPTYPEMSILTTESASMCSDPNFVGLFLLQHEHKGMDDGYSRLSVYQGGKWIPMVASGSIKELTKDNVCRTFKKNLS